MKITHKIVISIFLVASCAQAAPTHKKTQDIDTAAQPIAAPKENRIVRYTYSPDVIFRILTTPTQHTHIELGEDEGLKEQPVTGDTVQWRVSGGPRNLYVKPLRDGLETSMTVVTNRRTYQFQLISSKNASNIYQKVSFDFPDKEAEIRLVQDIQTAATTNEEKRLSQQIITPNIDPSSLNFSYEVTGEATFKPVAVYDDGKFTYLRMPVTQDAPAIFLIDETGNPSLINYKTLDGLIRVERIANHLLMKLGPSEIRISRKKQDSPTKLSRW